MNRRASPFAAVALCLATAASAATAPAKYRIHWLLGHPNIDYFEEAAETFRRTVQDKSHGEIEVVVDSTNNPWEDAGTGLPGPEIAEAVSRGEAEMGHSFADVMGGLDHRLWVFDAPFLFRDYKHQEQVFEGPIGQELLAGLSEHGLKGLAFTYSGGANAIFTRGKAVRWPEDLKGLRVAVFGSDVEKAWLTALGAVAVPVRHREEGVPALIKNNAVDAVISTWRRQYRASLSQDLAYGSAEGSTYLVSLTYINKKFFESLPPNYQDLIVSATRDAARIERQKTIELNARSRRRSQVESKLRSVDLSAVERDRFEEALAPVYRSALDELVGKDLIERIRRTGAEQARLP